MKLRGFAAVFAFAMLAGRVNADTRPSVAVYLDFESSPSAVSIAKMEQEVVSIMKSAGLELSWRMIADRDPRESFPGLVVVRFRGSCAATPDFFGTYSPEAQAAALADTAISDGRILSFSSVECDRLRRFIAPLTRGTHDRDAAMGRAMGRVVAHEMYHVLVETRGHGRQGVGRPSHTARDLVAPEFTFDARETQELQAYADRISRIK